MEREERERVAVVAAVVEPRGSVVGRGEKDRGGTWEASGHDKQTQTRASTTRDKRDVRTRQDRTRQRVGGDGNKGKEMRGHGGRRDERVSGTRGRPQKR